MNSNNNVVLTGASGFLGSHIVKKLKNNGDYRVVALSSKPEELKKKIGGSNIEYHHKDTLKKKESSNMLKDAIVINCAYPRNFIGAEIADGLKYIQSVFKAAVMNQAKGIINISSQSVYSQQRTEVATEITPISLENSYAVGKYSVELMLDSICDGSNTKFTNLRMASLIGPGFDQRIVNRFATKMLHHERITIIQQEKSMGFLDVDDAVEAVLSLLSYNVSMWKTVYNVGNGKGYTVEQIFKSLAFVLKDKIDVIEPIVEKGNDCTTTAVSYDKLNCDTAFTPKVELNESIKKILNFLNNE